MLQSQMLPLAVDVSWDRLIATVTVTGELDLRTAPGLTKRLLTVAAARPQRLVLDLHGAVFVDVAGARPIARVHEVLGDQCPVILRGPRPSARRVLELTGLMPARKQLPGWDGAGARAEVTMAGSGLAGAAAAARP